MSSHNYKGVSRIILNVYASNKRVSKHVKGKLIELQRERGNSMIKVRDFSTLLSITENLSKQKIRKNKKDQNNTINEINLIDRFRILRPKQQIAYCVQLCMEHLPRWTIKQVSINLKDLNNTEYVLIPEWN